MNNTASEFSPRVAILSTYMPKQCGLATFAAHVREAIMELNPSIIAVDDAERDFPSEVKLVVDKFDRQSYVSAASAINRRWDVIDIQHEYGIFGGEDGEYILDLVSNLAIPSVVTLHTILERPSAGQKKVMGKLCGLASRVVVMSDRASDILEVTYGVSCHKIDVIPHGVPDSDGVEPAPELHSFKDDPKLLTFGLLSPGKGIEVAIEAVAKIKEVHPNVRYFILGATHPDLKRKEGEAYRDSLVAQVSRLQIEKNVIFLDEFATMDRLCGFLAGSDIYVTPYKGKDQICSGTLSYAVGFGLPIVTTPFVYAEELVEKGGGLVFPFGDSERMAGMVIRLLSDPKFCGRIRNSSAMLGRTMRWPVVGRRLIDTFYAAIGPVETDPLQRLIDGTAITRTKVVVI